jgi:hypothetical protein
MYVERERERERAEMRGETWFNLKAKTKLCYGGFLCVMIIFKYHFSFLAQILSFVELKKDGRLSFTFVLNWLEFYEQCFRIEIDGI